MKPFTSIIVLSILITFTTAYEDCSESYTMAAQSLIDFRNRVLSHSFDRLSDDILTLKENTIAIQETCGEFITISPEVFSKDIKECSHAYTLVNSLVQDNIFNSLDDATLFQEFFFMFEDVVSFLIELGETNCFDQWRMRLGQQSEKDYMYPETEETDQEISVEFIFDNDDLQEDTIGVFVDLEGNHVVIGRAEYDDVQEDFEVEITSAALTLDDLTDAATETDDIEVFVPLYLELEDQEDVISVFVPEDEVIIEDDSVSVFVSLKEILAGNEDRENQEDSFAVDVPLYLELEDQEDTISVFVPEVEITFKDEEDDSIGVFVPLNEIIAVNEDEDNKEDTLAVNVSLYLEPEDQENPISVFVPVEVETTFEYVEDEIEEDDSIVVFVPLYFEEEDQEDSVSVFVSNDELVSEEEADSSDLFEPAAEILFEDEGEENSFGVFVSLYFEEEDQKDSISVFVSDSEINVGNEDDDDNSIGVFVPTKQDLLVKM